MPDENHLSARVLRDYRQGELAPSAMLDASDHLALCASCREALARTYSEPAYEELAAAVDGVLDPAARADLAARLTDAPAASAELLALQRFKEEMAPQAGRVYGPSVVPASAGVVVTPPAGTWRTRTLPWLAAAAAAVVLLVGGWWILKTTNPPAGDAALLADRDGQRVDLADLPADLRGSVERTLRTGHAEPCASDATLLRPLANRLAGPSGPHPPGFRVLAPAGAVVKEAQPTLRWEARPDAAHYYVTLAKLDGTDDRSSPKLLGTQTSWTVPEPLAPGATYNWQVEAVGTNGETIAKAPVPPAPDARFQVLSDSQRDALAGVEARFGRFPLVMATAYARAGLEEEAAGEWAKLAREHPDSVLARRLGQEAQSPSPISTKGAQ